MFGGGRWVGSCRASVPLVELLLAAALCELCSGHEACIRPREARPESGTALSDDRHRQDWVRHFVREGHWVYHVGCVRVALWYGYCPPTPTACMPHAVSSPTRSGQREMPLVKRCTVGHSSRQGHVSCGGVPVLVPVDAVHGPDGRWPWWRPPTYFVPAVVMALTCPIRPQADDTPSRVGA